MSEEKEVLQENEAQANETQSLADSVKALSPTQLVIKRFFRSKLSIVGLVLIIFLSCSPS